MIVSSLLEHRSHPFFVILAVPLSLIGIMIGTLYHDFSFGRGAIAGTLLSIGVVVNNAILLLHHRQTIMEQGIRGLRSWFYIYRGKFRTILITTLTTIGGLAPLIIWASNEFWSTLATVVIWGLSFSTVSLFLLMGIWERPEGLIKK